MSRVIRVIGAVVVSLFILASVALAALPNPGVFKGDTTNNAKARFEVSSKHNISLIKITEAPACDSQVTKLHDVHINSEGEFKASKSSNGIKFFTIEGKFVRKYKAKGSIQQITCSGEDSTYVVRRVQG
jgi:hypothetical protein